MSRCIFTKQSDFADSLFHITGLRNGITDEGFLTGPCYFRNLCDLGQSLIGADLSGTAVDHQGSRAHAIQSIAAIEQRSIFTDILSKRILHDHFHEVYAGRPVESRLILGAGKTNARIIDTQFVAIDESLEEDRCILKAKSDQHVLEFLIYFLKIHVKVFGRAVLADALPVKAVLHKAQIPVMRAVQIRNAIDDKIGHREIHASAHILFNDSFAIIRSCLGLRKGATQFFFVGADRKSSGAAALCRLDKYGILDRSLFYVLFFILGNRVDSI